MTNEEAKEAWKKLHSEIDKDNWLFVGTINPEMVVLAIKALEERPQGEWVGIIDYIKHLEETTGEKYLVNSTYYDQELYCNKCWEMSTRKTKFCCNCGAKMKKGGAEND